MYASEQSHSITESSIQEMLRKSRVNNSTKNISGLLIFFEGVFTQFLEGPAYEIDNLYARIIRDTRHTRIIELGSGHTADRYYSDWHMAYKKLSSEEVQNITGHKPLNKELFFRSPDSKAEHPGISLLSSFVNGLHFIGQ